MESIDTPHVLMEYHFTLSSAFASVESRPRVGHALESYALLLQHSDASGSSRGRSNASPDKDIVVLGHHERTSDVSQ